MKGKASVLFLRLCVVIMTYSTVEYFAVEFDFDFGRIVVDKKPFSKFLCVSCLNLQMCIAAVEISFYVVSQICEVTAGTIKLETEAVVPVQRQREY